ncbi:ion transporter [Alkalicoccus chagannorensis]|uniref:ion transporter n=1 Tax=Alkalicoccus chagannorensis TaxID=427072 RepID=UPI00054D79EC|nr:ion transporter [Alkalicoccus chagannorensis]
MERIQEKTFHIIKLAPPKRLPGKVFDLFLVALILLNVFIVVQEFTHPEAYAAMYEPWQVVRWFSLTFFTVEYVLRIWTAVQKYAYRDPVTGRLKYMTTPFMVIDFLAIVPFYLYQIDTLVVRILNIFKLLKLVKATRYVRRILAYERWRLFGRK